MNKQALKKYAKHVEEVGQIEATRIALQDNPRVAKGEAAEVGIKDPTRVINHLRTAGYDIISERDARVRRGTKWSKDTAYYFGS